MTQLTTDRVKAQIKDFRKKFERYFDHKDFGYDDLLVEEWLTTALSQAQEEARGEIESLKKKSQV